MTEPRAADDFAAIALRMREIAAGIDGDAECETCGGGGWECYGIGHHDPHFRECQTCCNPMGYPCP